MNKTYNSILKKHFEINGNDTFTGMLPSIHKISDREIMEMTEKYREINPDDKTSTEDLRPFIVNSIINIREINSIHKIKTHIKWTEIK